MTPSWITKLKIRCLGKYCRQIGLVKAPTPSFVRTAFNW
jgi:hypothetical protein